MLAFATFCTVVCVVLAVVSAQLNLPHLTLFFEGFAGPYALIALLSWRGLHRAAEWSLFFAIDAGIALLACLLGPESQVPMMFLLLMGYPYFVLRDSSLTLKRLALLVAPATLLLLEITDYPLLPRYPLAPSHFSGIRWPLMVTAFVAAVIMLEAFANSQEERRAAAQSLGEELIRSQRLETDKLAFQAAERRLSELVETAPAALATMQGGELVFANRMTRQLLGISAYSLPVRVSQYLSSEEPEQLEAALHGELHSVIEVNLTASDGSIHPAALSVKAHETREDTRYLMLRDLTEERRLKAEQERMENQLRQAQKLESLGVLAGGIAHDFNNLLTGILGNASLILAESEWNEDTAECCAEIELSAERAADLCKQMLAYAGKAKLAVGLVNLNEFVVDATRLLKLSIARTTELKVRAWKDELSITGDLTQLRQLTMNLVMNASEALNGKAGTVEVATGIHNRANSEGFSFEGPLPDGDCVYLEVSDTGCGMSEQAQSRIFEPFFTTKFSGRGLGLSAARGIVKAHGGVLGLKSKLEEGSTFRVVLPRADNVTLSHSTQPTSIVKSQLPWHRVLIVDDEAAVRKVLKRMLTNMGLEVLSAGDGIEALETLDREAVDLVFLDLTMPRMSGSETLRRLNVTRPNLPVILVSGFDAQDRYVSSVRSSTIPFVHKPFKLEELSKALNRAASDHEQVGQIS